jgi:hypothetical protein
LTPPPNPDQLTNMLKHTHIMLPEDLRERLRRDQLCSRQSMGAVIRAILECHYESQDHYEKMYDKSQKRRNGEKGKK